MAGGAKPPAGEVFGAPHMAAGAMTVTVIAGGLTSKTAASNVEATLVVPTVMLKLGGSVAGASKLGRRVAAERTWTPSSLADEREVQTHTAEEERLRMEQGPRRSVGDRLHRDLPLEAAGRGAPRGPRPCRRRAPHPLFPFRCSPADQRGCSVARWVGAPRGTCEMGSTSRGNHW